MTGRILREPRCRFGVTGRTVFSKAYGMANLSYGIPWEVDTRTNIGSTSKQFTAFAIMLLAERGELSLDDDVREHIPELPDLGETVTIRHILSHTSGYREFLNLLAMTGRRLDHGDFIDRSEIIDIVQRQPALQNSPGSEFNYNNTAFALAAVIVERISEQDFHEFMEENVFGPLGMTRTMVRPSPEHIVAEKSEGYTPGPGGIFLEIGDLGGAVGAGGIYSTVGDLQTWIENYANPVVGSPEIFQEMMTPNILTNGDTTGYGLGLFIDEHRGLRRVHHGGADVAHRSQLAYYPEINAGITTQSNHAGFDGTIAFRLAEAFFEADMEPEEERPRRTAPEGEAFDAAAYDPEAFDELAGRYALEEAPAFILRFFREDDTFFTQATGPAADRDRPHVGLDLRPRGSGGFGDLPPKRRGGGGRPHAPPERRPPGQPSGGGRRGVGARSRGASRPSPDGTSARRSRPSTPSPSTKTTWCSSNGGWTTSTSPPVRRTSSQAEGSSSPSRGTETDRSSPSTCPTHGPGMFGFSG